MEQSCIFVKFPGDFAWWQVHSSYFMSTQFCPPSIFILPRSSCYFHAPSVTYIPQYLFFLWVLIPASFFTLIHFHLFSFSSVSSVLSHWRYHTERFFCNSGYAVAEWYWWLRIIIKKIRPTNIWGVERK